MIEARYKRNLNHNYLSVMSDGAGHETYQARMLEANEIPGILPCRLDYVDGQAEYCYEITSKQPLAVLYGEKEMDYEMVCRIIRELYQVQKRLEEYLLEGSSLVLDKDFIFVNAESKTVFFCLVPHYHLEFSEAVHMLAAYLLNVIDNSDEKAVMLTYRLFRLSSCGSFSEKDLGNLLAAEGVQSCTEPMHRAVLWEQEAADRKVSGPLINEEKAGGFDPAGQKADIGGGCKGENRLNFGGESELIGKSEPTGKPQSTEKFGLAGKSKSAKSIHIGGDRIKKVLFICFVALDMALFCVCCVLFLDGHVLPFGFSLPSVFTDFVKNHRDVCLKLLGMGILAISILAVCLIKKLQSVRNRKKRKSAGSDFRCDGQNNEENSEENNEGMFGEPCAEALWKKGAEAAGEDHGEAENDCGTAPPAWSNIWDEEFMEHRGESGWSSAEKTGEESFGDTVLLTADLQQSYGYGEQKQDRSLTGIWKGEKLAFKIDKTPYLIGKLKGNVNAVIPDRSVSRIHARIQEEEGRYYLTDLNSTNGTSRNGEMLDAYRTVPIEPGDEVCFAGITLKFG